LSQTRSSVFFASTSPGLSDVGVRLSDSAKSSNLGRNGRKSNPGAPSVGSNSIEDTNPSSSPRPWHLGRVYAEQYQDRSVVDVYHLRPWYPEETFSLLAELCDPVCRRVLDVGCGTGEIARRLAPRVDHVDALDLSPAMLAKGKDSPGGDAPNLRWIHGEAESAAVDPPYGLVTAASSLHWMVWAIVLPRFAQILTPGGVLAIVYEHASGPPEPYANQLGKLILESLSDRGIAHREPWDLIEELQARNLFVVTGEALTEPVFQEQTVDEFVDSIHARTNFSRERMGAESAADFDSRAKDILLPAYPTGSLRMSVQMKVVWGRPSPTH